MNHRETDNILQQQKQQQKQHKHQHKQYTRNRKRYKLQNGTIYFPGDPSPLSSDEGDYYSLNV